MAGRFGSRGVLVATKGGLLGCVVAAGEAGVVDELAALLRRFGGLRAGVGRAQRRRPLLP